MIIAKVENGVVVDLADYRSMFPDTSFPSSGPSQEFMDANGCMHVSMWKQYDHATQKLESVAPYIEAPWVYTISVVDKTEEDLLNEKIAQNARNKASRGNAYREEADPIFFKSQRGEATQEEWLAKVAEIKARFPIIDVPVTDSVILPSGNTNESA